MGEVWQLFIDESGNFDDPEEPVVVGGLLLRAEDSPALRRYLRRKLERAYPLVPFPHHASHLNQIASRVAAAALVREEPSALAAREALAMSRPAVELVRRAVVTVPELAPFVRAIDEAAWPSFDAIVACGDWLWASHRGEARRLRDLSLDQDRSFAKALAEIPVEHCFALAARDGGDTKRTSGDRYLALLEVLLERVLMLLRGCDPVQKVWVHVADRLAIVADLPRRVMLRARDVGDVVRAAERFPWRAPPVGRPDERVRLVPHQPSAFRNTVHPGIVWADFIANRTRRRLGSDAPWTTVLDDVRGSLGLALAAARSDREPQLPMAAPTGPARLAVRQRYALDAVDVPRGGPPRWVWDQAAAWMEVGP